MLSWTETLRNRETLKPCWVWFVQHRENPYVHAPHRALQRHSPLLLVTCPDHCPSHPVPTVPDHRRLSSGSLHLRLPTSLPAPGQQLCITYPVLTQDIWGTTWPRNLNASLGRQTWIWVQKNCGGPDRIIHLSELHFSKLCNEDKSNNYAIGLLWELSDTFMSFINEEFLKHLLQILDTKAEKDKYWLVSHTWVLKESLTHRGRVRKWLLGARRWGEIGQVGKRVSDE